jgi:hypothetical protein
MVLFQRKIIYMGYIPPGARQEVRNTPLTHNSSNLTQNILNPQTLDPNDPLLAGLDHRTIVVQSEPGIVLQGFGIRLRRDLERNTESRRVVVIYFQGRL